MASLTPGVLSKLLQNVGNENVKVVGEHRSALLQVIGILPSFSGADDDPWKSKGFYLRVSDSVHSAYVSVSDSDAELILNDTIQLGQFVHVTRLDSGLPVPVLRGLKPLPKRRPCVGEPKDLISSEALQIRNRVDFKKGRKAEAMPKPKPKAKVDAGRVNVENLKNEGLDQLKILSLDPTRKSWNRSPTRTTAKNAVPDVKSKQSLTPSGPSNPVGSRRSFSDLPSQVGSRRSFSEKEWASEQPNSSITPIKNKNVIVSHRRSFSEKDLTLESPNSSITPLKNKIVIVSEKLISKPVKKDLKSSFECSIPSHFTKVPISYKTWPDANILWDAVPPTIQNLGKEIIYHRNGGFLSAVQALEETYASEGILQCLSVFAEICESAQQDCTNPLVEPFLNLYQNIQKAAETINSLLDTMSEDRSGNLLDTSNTFKNKNAALWVQAAIDTDLSKFSLFSEEDQNDLRNGNNTHFVVLQNTPKAQKDSNLPENKQLKGHNGPKTLPLKPRQRVRATKKQAVERAKWSKGQGLNDAASLAEKLLTVTRAWFLSYLEDSLKNGFGLKKGEEDSEITGLLGQLKRVNEWLDESVGNGSQMDERVECLRKELYTFLLDHVDSAIVQASNQLKVQIH